MDVSDEEWHALFELNVMSAIRVSRGFIPSMQSQKWGPIINATSENCVQPDAVAAQYSLTKAALINLTESLSTAFAADNILVNAVSPAFVMTPMVRGFIGELAAQLGVGFDDGGRGLSQGLPATPRTETSSHAEEVAAAALFLASDQASFTTGSNVRVDGGSVASL